MRSENACSRRLYLLSALHCKSWELFGGPEAPRLDFVIGLCDMADRQSCPDFGDKAVTGSWSLPDPAKFTGRGAERAAMLNELYASLHQGAMAFLVASLMTSTGRIAIFVNLPFDKLDRMAIRARLDEIGAGPVAMLARVQEA